MNELLESLKTALIMGYSVRFSSIGFQLYLEIEKNIDIDKMLSGNTACMPMDDNHFDQERISDCLSFLINRQINSK